jgi:DNA-binding transcriptional LysR family regulator
VLRHTQSHRRYHGEMKDLAFDDLHLFARVAALGTLSAAARERDVPVSQVSRALSRIEQTCATRLVHRSTHGLALTAEGEIFLGYCLRIVGTLDELEGEFAAKTQEPCGLVRVAASTVIAQYQLLPSLPGLCARHPGLRIELEVGDRLADMARDGIDIAIRTSTNLPETVIARQIGTLSRALYAAPQYLARAGAPSRPQELHQHRLITNSAVTQLNHWPFVANGTRFVIVADGHWRSNDTNVVAAMVLQGLGIGRLSTIAAEPLVQQQRLVPVLAEFVEPQTIPIYAVTASARHRLPKIRACIDYWAQWLRPLAAGTPP